MTDPTTRRILAAGAVLIMLVITVVGSLWLVGALNGSDSAHGGSINGNQLIVCDGAVNNQPICNDLHENRAAIGIESERNDVQDISIAVGQVRLDDLERRVGDLENQVLDHETRLSRLEGTVALLEEVYKDLGCGCAANAHLMTQFELVADMSVGTPYESRMVRLMVAIDECGRFVLTGTTIPGSTTTSSPGTTTTNPSVATTTTKPSPGTTTTTTPATTTTTTPATTTTTTAPPAKFPPVASATGPGSVEITNPDTGTSFCISGTGSYDPDGGSIVSYSWTSVQGGLAGSSSSSPCFTVYEGGNYKWSLIVTDDEGATSPSASITVTAYIYDQN